MCVDHAEVEMTGPEPGTATEIGTMEGLIERSASAFVSGVPVEPADDGYFGPASVAWRLSGGLAGPVSGLRALLVQALHPLAMAGVDQHSDWRADPAARYASTLKYLVVTTYGDKAAADKAARIVRTIHTRVNGTDTVTGKPYAADDPDLLLWVHAVEVDSVLATARRFGPDATPAEEDAYVAEMTSAAGLIGMPEGLAPASVAELDAYLEKVRPELLASPAAVEAAAYLVDPPDLDESVAGLWGEFRDGVLGSLPAWAAKLYGWEPVELSEDRCEEIRQALGVFDALSLGEPGVLEARQRLELRIREAARSAHPASGGRS